MKSLFILFIFFLWGVGEGGVVVEEATGRVFHPLCRVLWQFKWCMLSSEDVNTFVVVGRPARGSPLLLRNNFYELVIWTRALLTHYSWSEGAAVRLKHQWAGAETDSASSSAKYLNCCLAACGAPHVRSDGIQRSLCVMLQMCSPSTRQILLEFF